MIGKFMVVFWVSLMSEIHSWCEPIGSTLTAMTFKLRDFYRADQTLLLVVGGAITAIALWLLVEAALALRRYRRGKVVAALDIALPPD